MTTEVAMVTNNKNFYARLESELREEHIRLRGPYEGTEGHLQTCIYPVVVVDMLLLSKSAGPSYENGLQAIRMLRASANHDSTIFATAVGGNTAPVLGNCGVQAVEAGATKFVKLPKRLSVDELVVNIVAAVGKLRF